MVDRRLLNFNFLLKFFKSSRLHLISKSFTDDAVSRNFQTAASVSSPLSISGSKLPNIGFCPSDFDMSLNTTSYGFRPPQNVLIYRIKLIFNLSIVQSTVRKLKIYLFLRILPYFARSQKILCKSLLFSMLLINSLWKFE